MKVLVSNSLRSVGAMFAIALGVVAALSFAPPTSAEEPQPDPATVAAIDAWRRDRFGLFVHWGPASVRGAEISWTRGKEIPANEYDALYEQFNPTEFDADEWVRIAKSAGMKYLVFTSKHHDGFCLWPTRFADYHIGETPFGRDVVRELSMACRGQGVQFSLYYSIPDWRGPDYGLLSPGGSVKNPHPNMPRHFELVKNQTRELVDSYGPLGCLWFDGDWEEPWTQEYGDALYNYLKGIQPSLLINNRVSKGRLSRLPDGRPAGRGDFDTPEQRIGGFDRIHPWESCITLCTRWGWTPNDELKSLQECLQTLLRTVGGDGNLLLNVGPMPNGQIEPRQVARLREIGTWLATYGEGVYGTRGGPFRPGEWGASTCKDDKIYVFVMNWPETGPLHFPPIKQEILSAKMLSAGDASVNDDADGVEVDMPIDSRDAIATVIELTVSGRAYDIDPRRVTLLRDSLVFDRPTTATNVFQDEPEYGAACATDDDPSTRWATDGGLRTVELEVDLEKASMIERIAIEEPAEYPRIKSFEIERFDGHDWQLVCQGSEVGERWSRTMEPVIATRVRLRIFDATDGPTISEFQVFGQPVAGESAH